jgi:hypothetical protein
MEVEITLTGPIQAVSALRERLRPFSPALQVTADGDGRLRIRETEKNLDDTLLTISRILIPVEKGLSPGHGLTLRVRNLAYAEPETPEFSEEPFRPTGSILIQPWHPSLSEALPGRTIIIDERHAFGTGRHPSTVLCLRAMEELASARGALGAEAVLDFGCGTGLLAIAAVKMGAKRAFAVEIDPEAAERARRNVWINGVSDRVNLKQGSWEAAQGVYDLILANLVPSVLFKTGHEIPRHLEKKGRAVIAGFSEKQAGEMEAHLCSVGLQITGHACMDGWAAFVGEHRSSKDSPALESRDRA